MSEPPTVSDSPHGEDGQTPTPLLSKKEAAARLGVTEKTIERYVNEYGLLVPAGQDPRTGAKQFDPVDIDRLRQSPPPRRKGRPDSRGMSEFALQGLVAAMQQAHAETVRAKDETIAALRDQLDSLRQSQQQLTAGAPDTGRGLDMPGQSMPVADAERDAGQQNTLAELRRQVETAEAARLAAEHERDALRARLDTAQAAPEAPGAPTLAVAGADAPRRPAGLWGQLRRALGRP